MQYGIDENKKYWRDLPEKEIIGRITRPDKEFFDYLNKHDKILELGCGTGEMAEYMATQGYEISAIDINNSAIKKNSTTNTKVKYLYGDITETLPFQDNSFDGIAFSVVLVSIVPLAVREKLVSEINRVLKPGGVVWLNEPLVSDAYKERYILSRPFVEEDYNHFSFKKGISSSSIKNIEQMKEATENGTAVRTCHHFNITELQELFSGYKMTYKKLDKISSPNTGNEISMCVLVFKKL